MNFKSIALAASALVLSTSLNASVIYSFDVSDVSWNTSQANSDFSNTTVWFEFTDSADLNALVDYSDLLNMGFDDGVSQVDFSLSNLGNSNIDGLFAISGGVASLTVGGIGTSALWCSGNCNGNSMQLGQGGSTSLRVNANSAFNSTTSHTYYSTPSAVPVPAAVWLFGSGLIGLVGVARRKTA